MAWPWHRSRSASTRLAMIFRGPPLLGALAVAHLGRLGKLNDHLRVVILVTIRWLRHLELVLAQQHREDRLDLHRGERGTDAAVTACTKRDIRPPVGDIGLFGLVVAVWIESVRVG